MKTYNFGIIGLGMIADFHVKALRETAGGSFVAGFDSAPGKAKLFCDKNGGKPYDDLNAFLADPAIDIVTIATPSGAHLDTSIPALNAGKHVIIEKPLEITKDRCMEITATAKKNGKKVAGIFPSRYHEAPKLIKKAVDEGRFGKIVMADAQVKWFRTQEYYDSGAWRGTWKLDGGGALMNQSIHGIDLLQWFMGEVTEVSAFTATLAHERIEVEDSAAAILKFKNGAIGVIEGTTGAYPGFLKKIEICGTRGSVILEEENITAWNFAEEKPEDAVIIEKFCSGTKTGGGASDPSAIGFHGHKMLFESFIQALDENKNPDIDGVEAAKAVEIIEAIYLSAQKGQHVMLPLEAGKGFKA